LVNFYLPLSLWRLLFYYLQLDVSGFSRNVISAMGQENWCSPAIAAMDLE
jgi:hypothetical protein